MTDSAQLDAEVNPDPFHELPPPPPIRPGAAHTEDPFPGIHRRGNTEELSPGAGGFLNALLGGILGSGAAVAGESDQNRSPPHTPFQPPHLPGEGGAQRQRSQATQQGSEESNNNAQGNHNGLRTFNFNLGGGQGSVTFGAFGGGMGGGSLGPSFPGDDGGLESYVSEYTSTDGRLITVFSLASAFPQAADGPRTPTILQGTSFVAILSEAKRYSVPSWQQLEEKHSWVLTDA